MKCVIYKATNIINGKSYIGFTTRWPSRKFNHLKATYWNSAYSNTSLFYRAIRKYGKVNFSWEILKSSDNVNLINEEANFIREYQTFGKFGYNLTVGGEGVIGYTVTEEQRRKMRLAKLGKSPWNKGKKMSSPVWNKGKKTGPRHRVNSNKLKGRTYEEIYGKEKAQELRRLRSERMKLTKAKHTKVWNKGKKCPTISEAAKKRKTKSPKNGQTTLISEKEMDI